MKRILYIASLSSTGIINAQNMVSNPSFEDYETCPGPILSFAGPTSAATTALHWYQPTAGTADYFNTCAPPAGSNSVPLNFTGYQYPRTGNGYAGIHSMQIQEDTDYREYLETELSTTMIAGHKYYVNYWINMADFREMGNLIAIDQMGALFRNTYIDNPSDFSPIAELPQVVSTAGLTYSDTLGWQKVDGIFTATGVERWMVIGNFTDKNSVSRDTIYKGGVIQQLSYYHIEDVCVTDMEGTVENTFAHDTTLCIGQSFQLTAPDTLGGFIWEDGTAGIDRTINSPGVYWFKSVNLNTCSLRIDTFRVRHERTEVSLYLGNDTMICRDMPFSIDAYNEIFDTYRWNTGDNTSSIEVATPGTYYVRATSDCYIGSDTIVLQPVLVHEVVLPADTLVCEGAPVDLRFYQQGNHYYWSTGSEECCITVDEPGVYSLTLTNICGETDTDEIEVIHSGCDHCILTPTAFSPNGDGLNDNFQVQTRCLMKAYKLSIFNRWGQIVFSTVNPDRHWDGLVNGTPANVGVYFFYIEGTPAVEGLNKIIKKGDLTLIR